MGKPFTYGFVSLIVVGLSLLAVRLATPSFASDYRPWLNICQAKVVDEIQKENPTGLPADIEKFVATDFTARLNVGSCLADNHQLVDAKAAYLAVATEMGASQSTYDDDESKYGVQVWAYDMLANVEDELGESTNAIHNIDIARDLAHAYHEYISDDIVSEVLHDFRRIDGGVPRYLAVLHAYWDSFSPDEQMVLSNHLGSRDDPHSGDPCHKEIFDGELGHEETWWYCGGTSYSDAYTFRNHKLISHYQP